MIVEPKRFRAEMLKVRTALIAVIKSGTYAAIYGKTELGQNGYRIWPHAISTSPVNGRNDSSLFRNSIPQSSDLLFLKFFGKVSGKAVIHTGFFIKPPCLAAESITSRTSLTPDAMALSV